LTEQRGVRHPIDFFFRSLAVDQGESAIGVILSGTGSEGALGLRAIKGEGGLVLAQDPKDSKYEGMPSSAIATGLVDHILPAAGMPDLLLRYTKVTADRAVRPPAVPAAKPVEALTRIFTLIRAQTGHDFSLYKQNTIIRRINKRMAIHQIETLGDYVTLLRGNPHEIDVLFTELLIRVTSFFRDSEAFESFTANALPLLFKNKSYDNAVRIWVPGCSTGEEAYSLAILCQEYAREMKGNYKIQLFATDIDTGAIDIARSGAYSDSINADMTAERLNRYFVKKSGAYRVKDEIREMVVFAVQDLIKDPPFSRLDLICCRNVLIYMGPTLQQRVLALFHYALGPEGILFLGSSETVGDASDLFAVVDKRWKIYKARRVETLPAAAVDLRYAARVAERERLPAQRAEVKAMLPNLEAFTEKFILERYTPPCAVVNEKGDILYFHGRTGSYLEPASGKASLNIFEMAREGIRLELRTGVRKVLTQKKEVSYTGLQVKTNGGYRAVNLDIKYVEKPEHLRGLVMVVFSEKAALSEEKTGKTPTRAIAKETDEKQAALEYELKSAKEHLQTTIEELETANEELKSTNEELQSSNEELQSSNEELETSREELQSTNEELLTVNTELQHKIEELSEANSDIVNLLASTQIATVFLTGEFRIRRFTPIASDVINIIQSDIGRPLSDISIRLDYPDLVGDTEEVLRTLSAKERTVRHQDGRWYLARVVPYRTVDNLIDGVVLTFVNITEQKRAQQLGDSILTCLHGIVDIVRQPLLVLDANLHVLAANDAFFETFKVNKKESEGRLLYNLGNRQWDIPALRKLLTAVIAKNESFHDYDVEHEFPDIGRKKMRLNGRRICLEGFGTETILLAIEDTTGKDL
ncbi:MAG TPA: CheR family methyltransferase, partial [Thermodesulfovibrionales bacterium]|nr:CheR family methyltransferase [Thermodesulfovibrionales bacterium]